MELVQHGDSTVEARKDILNQQRAELVARMEEMQKPLYLLAHKIEIYEKALLKTEQAFLQVAD